MDFHDDQITNGLPTEQPYDNDSYANHDDAASASASFSWQEFVNYAAVLLEDTLSVSAPPLNQDQVGQLQLQVDNPNNDLMIQLDKRLVEGQVDQSAELSPEVWSHEELSEDLEDDSGASKVQNESESKKPSQADQVDIDRDVKATNFGRASDSASSGSLIEPAEASKQSRENATALTEGHSGRQAQASNQLNSSAGVKAFNDGDFLGWDGFEDPLLNFDFDIPEFPEDETHLQLEKSEIVMALEKGTAPADVSLSTNLGDYFESQRNTRKSLLRDQSEASYTPVQRDRAQPTYLQNQLEELEYAQGSPQTIEHRHISDRSKDDDFSTIKASSHLDQQLIPSTSIKSPAQTPIRETSLNDNILEFANSLANDDIMGAFTMPEFGLEETDLVASSETSPQANGYGQKIAAEGLGEEKLKLKSNQKAAERP